MDISWEACLIATQLTGAFSFLESAMSYSE